MRGEIAESQQNTGEAKAPRGSGAAGVVPTNLRGLCSHPMVAPTLSRTELLDRLLDVFRSRGFEGATVAEISRRTGLGKASLYHHFPGGKDEMVEVVTREVCARLNQDVFGKLNRLTNPVPANERIAAMIDGFDQYFAGGEHNCLLAVMSLGTARERLGLIVREEQARWLEALTQTYAENGASKKEARREARELFVRIHGAIIMARLLDDPKPFRQTIRRLLKDLRGTE